MPFLPSLLTALLVSPFADGFVNPQRPLISRDLTRVNAASFGSSNSFDDHKKPSKAKGEKNARTFNEIGLVAEKAGLYAEGAFPSVTRYGTPHHMKPSNAPPTIRYKRTTVARTTPRTTARQRRPSLTPRPRPTPAFFIAAAAAYKRAIVEEPWNPVAHGNLGNALSELGLEALQECIDEYHTAAKLALARPDKNLKKSNARLASEYLVNLALTLLHVPSTVKRHHPRVAAEPDRVDEALAALKHAMHLCPKDEAIKFMYVGLVLWREVNVHAELVVNWFKGLMFSYHAFSSLLCHSFHRYADSLKDLKHELETTVVSQR